MTIHLMPDWIHVAIQIVVFLSALSIIYFLVLRPIFKIIDRRSHFSANARLESATLNSMADEFERERKASLVAALKNAEVGSAEKIAIARREADKIVATARKKAKEDLDLTEESIEASEEAVKKEFEKQADVLAEQVAARILGN